MSKNRSLFKSFGKGRKQSLQTLFDEIVKMDETAGFYKKLDVKIGARVVEPLIRLFNFKS
jgi:hypothetical protein